MTDFRVRAMETPDHTEVAELICASMNVWDILHGGAPGRFTGGAGANGGLPGRLRALDPGIAWSRRISRRRGCSAPASTGRARRTSRSGS